METLTAITENNEEDKQDLANLKQALIDGTFNVKYLTWAIMATNDENGNRIIDTYATIERLTQVLEALTQEISDRKAADDLEKNERKEETTAIINSVNQEISDRTNAVSVLNNLITAETENRASEDEKVLQYAQSVNEALGNAKTDLQGKIDSEAQTRLTNDNEIKASITSKEDSLKALINSVKNELNGYITTLNNRVNNLPTNYVFDTYESMTNDLLNASNTKYKVGDTLFIKEVNKPDYWVSAILSTKGTYGYYELSEQESKVDLSNYVKISELSREAIEEKFLETLENGITKSFASSSFTATNRNSGIDVNNYTQYVYDGVFFHKNGVQYPIAFPEKDGVFALLSDIPQALKNPFALTINGQVYDGSSAVSITTETITEHDFVRFWHDGIEIQNDGSEHVLRFSDFDTELEEFSPHISCQYDGPQYYWVWKFPQISGTFAMESQIPTKLSQLTNDGNYQTNTSDLKDNTTTFTTASTRSNVASGEKLSVSFGKISKYFNDLKAVAFSGSKADIDLGNVDNTSDANKPVSNATQQALNLKANASDVYTKTETDGLLNDKANTNDVYSKTKTDELLNNKANKSDVYTKTETDGLLNDKANASETDNKINKPLYNLGAYDTISGNVITRQTGYIVLDGSEDGWGIYTQGLWAYIKLNNIIPETNQNNVGQFITNRGPAVSITTMINTSSGIQIALGGESINIRPNVSSINSLDTFKQWLSQNNIAIQYKLATSYTEEIIEGQPLITLDQQGSQWLRDEWEKGLNLESFPNRTGRWWVTKQDDISEFINQLPNGTYNISADVTPLSIDSGYNVTDCFFWLQIYGGQYSSGDGIKAVIDNFTSLNQTRRGYLTFTKQSYTNYEFRLWGFGNHNGGNHGEGKCSNIMLVEGDHPYPYQAYNSKAHITNYEADFLKKESDRSSNLWKGGNLSYNVEYDGYQVFDVSNIDALVGDTITIKFKSTTYNDVLKFLPAIGKEGYVSNINGIYTLTFILTSGSNKLFYISGHVGESISFYDIQVNKGSVALPYQPYEGKVVHEKELESITPGIFTKLGNKTNFSFDSGSYLVVANNGMVTVTGSDPLNVGSSANKKYLGIFMVTIAEYDGGQSLRVNTEQVFFGDYASATISGPTFTIYRLN